MKLSINDEETIFYSLEIDKSINKLSSQCSFIIKEDAPSFAIGDEIKISDETTFEGQIEYIESRLDEGEASTIYAGRTKTGKLNDVIVDKTIQVTKSKKLTSLLGIELKGDVSLFAEDKIAIVGKNLGETIIKKIKELGKIVYGNETGDLIVEEEAQDGDETIRLGDNVLSRSYIQDNTKLFDKAIVFSIDEKGEETTGEDGSGERITGYVANSLVKKDEAQTLAKKFLIDKNRQAERYEVELAGVIDFKLNVKYKIEDEKAGINKKMNLHSIVFTETTGEKRTRAIFEGI